MAVTPRSSRCKEIRNLRIMYLVFVKEIVVPKRRTLRNTARPTHYSDDHYKANTKKITVITIPQKSSLDKGFFLQAPPPRPQFKAARCLTAANGMRGGGLAGCRQTGTSPHNGKIDRYTTSTNAQKVVASECENCIRWNGSNVYGRC